MKIIIILTFVTLLNEWTSFFGQRFFTRTGKKSGWEFYQNENVVDCCHKAFLDLKNTSFVYKVAKAIINDDIILIHTLTSPK